MNSSIKGNHKVVSDYSPQNNRYDQYKSNFNKTLINQQHSPFKIKTNTQSSNNSQLVKDIQDTDDYYVKMKEVQQQKQQQNEQDAIEANTQRSLQNEQRSTLRENHNESPSLENKIEIGKNNMNLAELSKKLKSQLSTNNRQEKRNIINQRNDKFHELYKNDSLLGNQFYCRSNQAIKSDLFTQQYPLENNDQNKQKSINMKTLILVHLPSNKKVGKCSLNNNTSSSDYFKNNFSDVQQKISNKNNPKTFQSRIYTSSNSQDFSKIQEIRQKLHVPFSTNGSFTSRVYTSQNNHQTNLNDQSSYNKRMTNQEGFYDEEKNQYQLKSQQQMNLKGIDPFPQQNVQNQREILSKDFNNPFSNNLISSSLKIAENISNNDKIKTPVTQELNFQIEEKLQINFDNTQNHFENGHLSSENQNIITNQNVNSLDGQKLQLKDLHNQLDFNNMNSIQQNNQYPILNSNDNQNLQNTIRNKEMSQSQNSSPFHSVRRKIDNDLKQQNPLNKKKFNLPLSLLQSSQNSNKKQQFSNLYYTQEGLQSDNQTSQNGKLFSQLQSQNLLKQKYYSNSIKRPYSSLTSRKSTDTFKYLSSKQENEQETIDIQLLKSKKIELNVSPSDFKRINTLSSSQQSRNLQETFSKNTNLFKYINQKCEDSALKFLEQEIMTNFSQDDLIYKEYIQFIRKTRQDFINKNNEFSTQQNSYHSTSYKQQFRHSHFSKQEQHVQTFEQKIRPTTSVEDHRNREKIYSQNQQDRSPNNQYTFNKGQITRKLKKFACSFTAVTQQFSKLKKRSSATSNLLIS